MSIQENISSNLKKYRREMGLSQEALAEQLGLSSQAVSKWECMQSIPDIEAIVALAELLGITTDKLLLDRDSEVVYQKQEVPGERIEVNICDTLSDDGVLRVLQFSGKRMLRQDELREDVVIPLCLGKAHSDIQIVGNVRVDGDVYGDINCVNVEHIGCCEGDISCGNVLTIEACEGDISCGNVQSINACEGDISCGNVGQIVSCEGDINCGDVEVITNCEGDIDCASVNIIQNCEGDICTE